MACNITISDLTYDCTQKNTGSLKRIKIGNLADYSALHGSISGKELASIPAAAGAVEIEFNAKDAFTNFNDTKTVDPSGSVSVVPTIQIEIPIMSKDHRLALEKLTTPNSQLVVFAEMANNEFVVVGTEFGLYGSSATGASGAARADKNSYQLTLTGEESGLCAFIAGADYDAKKAIFDAI